jgi:uncharacterized membrane protein
MPQFSGVWVDSSGSSVNSAGILLPLNSSTTMEKGRLEAFSDGVIAIIITIMVLEMKVPHGPGSERLEGLAELRWVFLSYVLSYLYIGIYWNNHHHLLKTVERVSGGIMWANLHLLFWLSLVPFVTGWMGENHFAPVPTALYGVVLLCSAVAYFILQLTIVAAHGQESLLAKATGKDAKAKLSMVAYVLAIARACKLPALASALYALVALVWLVPDRRIARAMAQSQP